MSSLETNRLLQDKTLNDDSLTWAAKQLSNLGISGLMTLEAIAFQTLELDAVLASCQQLQDSCSPLITNLPAGLDTCFQGSAASNEQLTALVKLIESAPQALWSLRDDSFNCYEMDFRLTELQQLLAILKPLNKKLAPFVNTNALGSVSTLKSIQCCLDNAGMFCWFSSKWRDAKQQALILATNEQLKLDDIQLLFPAMIKYVDTQVRFNELFGQAPILSPSHQGLHTDVAPLLAVREWYKDAEFAMSEHFVGEEGILAGLSVIEKQKADQLVEHYHASSVVVISSIDKQMSKLRLIYPGYQALQNRDADYVTAITELKTIIVNQLGTLSNAGVDSNTCLSEI